MDLFSHRKPATAAAKTLSVTQLLRRIRNVLEGEVGQVWIEGEVSNLRRQGSGHWYFTLKDDAAQISCAMFGARKRLGAEALEDGAKVRVLAEATVYEARGQLQVVVQQAERSGAGDLQAKFEALKAKLHAEGLFDPAKKHPLPGFPAKIGLVTSPTGAALQDILNVLTRRAPWVQPILFPVRVQGKGAADEISEGIRQLGSPERYGHPRCDLLIVARGGGSLEDLWCFNEETLARTIAACPIPIISAVGHEIDFTIADFVADHRAPTPSAAAEIAVPDGAELKERLRRGRHRLMRVVQDRLEESAKSLNLLRRGVLRRDAERLLREWTFTLDRQGERLKRSMAVGLTEFENRLQAIRAAHRVHRPMEFVARRESELAGLKLRLERSWRSECLRREERVAQLQSLVRTLGPRSALQRGFSITLDATGKIIRHPDQVKLGESVRTMLAEGEMFSRRE